MSNQIYPCLWFDGQAKAAAEFWTGIFPQSKIVQDTGMVVIFELMGKKQMGLNGGPMFQLNASISFLVHLDSREAIDKAWEQLSEGGTVMMGLDKYPWAERYGWIKDKFGMTWQLMLADMVDLTPSMLFQIINTVAVLKRWNYTNQFFQHLEPISKNYTELALHKQRVS